MERAAVRRRRRAMVLAVALAGTGLFHLVRPGFYDPIVPRALPGAARFWTYLAGVAELALAAGLAVPATRRRAAQAAVVFFVLVFPANAQMALDGGAPGAGGLMGNAAVAWARLPLQVPLIGWAWSVARSPGAFSGRS